MQKYVVQISEGVAWVDCVEPTHDDLISLAATYGLHSTSVEDCLDPSHLPKFEAIGPMTFIILRSYDESCAADSDSVQELTRKVALFYTSHAVITVHRTDQPFLKRLREKWSCQKGSPGRLIADILCEAMLTYDFPLDRAFNQLDEMEIALFQKGHDHDLISDTYFLKRTASVLKRVIRTTQDMIPKIGQLDQESVPFLQDARDEVGRIYFVADDLLENVNDLNSLYLSIEARRTNEASYRTNEVMRVLTLFSVFFLPLNFLAGVYGMNFKHMPELEWTFGYPLILAFMVGVAVALYSWFRRSGLIR